jgi:hypothetical protein
MAGIAGLGRLFDFGTGWAPVDLDTSNGATGKRVSLAGATGITFLVTTGVGGSEDLVLDVQQHTAYTSGTSNDLDSTAVATSTGVTYFYIKAETALDNDESWVKVTQSEASECTVVGATYGTQQKIVAIYVAADQLGDGYGWVSLNAAITTGTAQLSSCTYVLHDLASQRTPANLPNLLRPGAANA